jgi:hypothetical protein
MSEKVKQAVIEGGMAFLAFVVGGYALLDWGPANLPDWGTAKSAIVALVIGGFGAAVKAVLWYFTGTVKPT